MIFEKTFQEFKDIHTANSFAYGYEDKALTLDLINKTERLIIMKRNDTQIYHTYIYEPITGSNADWDDFETNYKAGAT